MLLSIPQTVFWGYLPPKQATELLILINTKNNWRWPQKSKCQQITFQWHVFQTPITGQSTNHNYPFWCIHRTFLIFGKLIGWARGWWMGEVGDAPCPRPHLIVLHFDPAPLLHGRPSPKSETHFANVSSLKICFSPLPSSEYNIDLCRNCLADLGSTLVASDDVNIRGRELPPFLFLSPFFTTLWFCQMCCCLAWSKVKSFHYWLFFTTSCLRCTMRFLAECIKP